ncbi:SGNH/GDSL hydrolase family protein [Actinoplanes sp. NPDC051494]|uniref:SGNH/GDSL hydrolase family protein n=1 Tax=Actinoplanes sp. NPDC051494 TaxID=3363907 RepID=UPI0037907886
MRYAAVGDSFSEGMGDELPDGTPRGWTDLVAAGLAGTADEPVEYANFAIRGRLLQPIVDDQVETALALSPPPTLMTLNGGGNDMMRPGSDMPQLVGLLDRAIKRVTEAGVRLVVISGADPGDRLPFGGMIRRRGELLTTATIELVERYGAQLVDVFHDVEIRRAPYWSADRLHLNANGHRRVAGLVLTALGRPGTAHVVDPGPAESRRVLAEAKYYREHVLPWVTRRLRGQSSGDRRSPKYVDWTPISPA